MRVSDYKSIAEHQESQRQQPILIELTYYIFGIS